MNEKMNLENLKRACERMVSLLSDPQPGLISWHAIFHQAADDIRFELDGSQSCVREVQKRALQGTAEGKGTAMIWKITLAVVLAGALAGGAGFWEGAAWQQSTDLAASADAARGLTAERDACLAQFRTGTVLLEPVSPELPVLHGMFQIGVGPNAPMADVYRQTWFVPARITPQRLAAAGGSYAYTDAQGQLVAGPFPAAAVTGAPTGAGPSPSPANP